MTFRRHSIFTRGKGNSLSKRFSIETSVSRNVLTSNNVSICFGAAKLYVIRLLMLPYFHDFSNPRIFHICHPHSSILDIFRFICWYILALFLWFFFSFFSHASQLLFRNTMQTSSVSHSAHLFPLYYSYFIIILRIDLTGCHIFWLALLSYCRHRMSSVEILLRQRIVSIQSLCSQFASLTLIVPTFWLDCAVRCWVAEGYFICQIVIASSKH